MKRFNLVWVSVLAAGLSVAVAGDKLAYLGVAALPLDPALSYHLNLPEGVGLMVAEVTPDGPAKGKIEPRDILHKLDDQVLVTPEQLVVLVRSRKAGDTVKLAIVRRGHPEMVEVKLGEQDRPRDVLFPRGPGNLPPRARPFRMGPQGGVGIVDPDDAVMNQIMPRVREMLESMGMQAPQLQPGPGPAEGRPEADTEAKPEGSKPAQPRKLRPLNPGGTSTATSHTQATSVQMEGDVSCRVDNIDGQRTAEITRDGRSVFKGPVNTPKDLEKVPEEFREKIRQMNKGLRVHRMETPEPDGPVI